MLLLYNIFETTEADETPPDKLSKHEPFNSEHAAML